jgi:hypothetical protein
VIEMLECTACGWTGDEKDAVMVPTCPECTTGHLKMFRLIKKRDGTVECPKCTWKGKLEDATMEPECPKCGNPYLRKI